MQTYTYSDNEHEYSLSLTNTGKLDKYYSKPVVQYILTIDNGIVFDGIDLYASPMSDPEGKQIAADCISLLFIDGETSGIREGYTEHEDAVSLWVSELEETEEDNS